MTITRRQLVKAVKAVERSHDAARAQSPAGNLAAVARVLDVAPSTAKEWLRKAGMWPVSPQALEARRIYATGLDREEVAEHLGLSLRHTARLLIEADTPMRPRGRRRTTSADVVAKAGRLVAKGATIPQAATQLGLNERTLRRHLAARLP